MCVCVIYMCCVLREGMVMGGMDFCMLSVRVRVRVRAFYKGTMEYLQTSVRVHVC